MTTVALLGFLGLATTGEFADEAILPTTAAGVLGSPLDRLVILAVVLSALASTQTTTLPASRTLLSMARQEALPASLGKVHPRYLTPHVATVAVGAVALGWYVVLNGLLEDFLAQTLLALLIGVAPLLGAVALACILFRAALEFVVDAEGTSETGATWLGVAPPLVIGVGFLILGALLMLAWRAAGRGSFFDRRPETVGRELVSRTADPSSAAP